VCHFTGYPGKSQYDGGTTSNPQIDEDTTRAMAHLPGLDIEIVHRRSPIADAEQISISLQAVPSFEAFGRFLQTANPFALWVQAVQLSWFPWLGAASAVMFPWRVALEPPKLNSRNKEPGNPRTL
jgi:hypothetical protein